MSDRAFVIFWVVVIFVLLVGAIELLSLDLEKWDTWRQAHHCRIEGYTQGAFAGRDYVGGQTLWRCDDGMLHGRRE